ncbi:MAG TPA: MerR family transcriptional regulator [Gaiellales bacterium]|nr:MerR family transcriptional regulator [Gaiellales bacterium]
MAQRRIGEMARRVGISPELLRAWERRYGLLEPVRTEAGYRLYSEEDERRVREMVRLVDSGVSPQQAASTVRSSAPAGPTEPSGRSPEAEAADLTQALARFDEAAADAALDRVFATYSLEAVLGRVVLPVLDDLGERWANGSATVAEEHFASNLIRGRLLGLARGWDAGAGPRAVLACPAGERHDLGLVAFGLALRSQGWRITFLGADTPAESLADTARLLRPAVVVLSAATSQPLADVPPIPGVPPARLAFGGRGATAELAKRAGAELLDPDMFSAAGQLAVELRSRARA